MLVLDDEGDAVDCNDSWTQLTGRGPEETLGGGWLAAVAPDEVSALWDALTHAGPGALDVRVEGAGGPRTSSSRWTRWSWLPDAGGGRVVAVVDVDADRSRERDLHDRATRDPLTGVANRRQFLDTLAASIAGLGPDGDDSLVLLYLDLDRFKSVNDVGGHEVGDEVLVQVGKRLLAATRPDDLVGRLGGDEFGVICTGIGRPTDPQPLVLRILDAFAEPFSVHGVVWSVSATLGVAVATDPGYDPTDLLRSADECMYAAKPRDPATVVEVTEQARDSLLEAASLLGRLWSASIAGDDEATACAERLSDAARQVRSALRLLGPQVIA